MSGTKAPEMVHRTTQVDPPPGTPLPHRRGGRRRRDQRRQRLWAWVVVASFGGFAMLPIYWLLVTALTPNNKAFSYPPSFFPTNVTFEHFASLADNPQLLKYLVNSVIVSIGTALLSVVVSAYMAYSFSKFRYRGRRSLMYLVLSSQMFPQALLLITLYAVFSAYGLLNTYTALVLSFTTFTLPLCVWMLKGFFDTIPDSLIEAARIDGASRLRIIHSIVIPLSAPGSCGSGSVRLCPRMERLHLRPHPRRARQADAAPRARQHLPRGVQHVLAGPHGRLTRRFPTRRPRLHGHAALPRRWHYRRRGQGLTPFPKRSCHPRRSSR